MIIVTIQNINDTTLAEIMNLTVSYFIIIVALQLIVGCYFIQNVLEEQIVMLNTTATHLNVMFCVIFEHNYIILLM